MKSVVVAGAGFAGLAAALELARSGKQVTVCESLAQPGGRARRFVTQQGFIFDAGPTLIVMVDALRQALGPSAFADLGLRRIDPGYRVLWRSGEHFDMYSDFAAFMNEIGRFEGVQNRAAAVRYTAQVHEQYAQARKNILEVDHTPLSFARMLLTPGKFASWPLGKLLPFVRRFFHSERVLEAMTFQPLYLGTSPLRAPAMYALLAVEEIIGGVWYAPGGTGAIVDALVAECKRHGVELRYNTAVRGIRTVGHRLRHVETDCGTLQADGFVIAADREIALQTLFEAPVRSRTLRYGHSAMLWYAGIRGSVELGHHTVMLPADPLRAYAQLDHAQLPDDPMIYACNPVVSDPSVAPVGDSSVMLLSPVPNMRALSRFDERAYFDRVLARVENHTGPLRDRIVELRFFGPRQFASELNLAHGAAFGPDHTLDQMGPLRPPIRHPRLGNVVFAGSGTRPGSGIPMVLISGRLAAQRLNEALA